MCKKDFIAVREELKMVGVHANRLDSNVFPLNIHSIHHMDIRDGVVIRNTIAQISFTWRDTATMEVLFLCLFLNFLPASFQIGDGYRFAISVNHQSTIWKDDGRNQIHVTLFELEEFQIKKLFSNIRIDVVDAKRWRHIIIRHGEEIERIIRRVP